MSPKRKRGYRTELHFDTGFLRFRLCLGLRLGLSFRLSLSICRGSRRFEVGDGLRRIRRSFGRIPFTFFRCLADRVERRLGLWLLLARRVLL